MQQQSFMLANEVATLLGVCADRVRALADAGTVQCIRTPSGTRLFPIDEVEKEIERRRSRQDPRLRVLPRRTRLVRL